MKVKWNKINVGDFFFVEFEEMGTLLYQRITERDGYNAVLLNTGELCQIYTSEHSEKLYEKVTVTFDIHNID